jgi:AcrR family transcriptional regulator
MEERSEKFIAIITAARELFWKHGIRRVSIDEICQEADVSKMTFYKYFSNKSAAAVYIIEEMFHAGMEAYKEIFNSEIPYEEKVRKVIELKMSNTHELSQELLDDLYKNKDLEIDSTIESVKNTMLTVYLEDFRNAQKNGEIRADVKPEFILYFLNHFTEMLTDEKLVSMYPNTEEMIREVLSFFFYGIMPYKQKVN